MGIKNQNVACNCGANGGSDVAVASKENRDSKCSASGIKGKMKVLKKIKKRMGLVSRSGSHGGGTNNLPPLLFHNVHGDNIRISRDGTVARRVESFCKGIAFSSRPVKVNEKVCLQFIEISNNWSGVIRFGFTYNDPATLRNGLPKYACPDLTNKPGYWAKALGERFCNQNIVLFYYVTSAGDVHFGINGEEKGVFITGVETRGPLWALVDVYGNSTAVEFVDIRHQLNNNRRITINGCDNSADEIERLVRPMQGLSFHRQDSNGVGDVAADLQPLRWQPSGLYFSPMQLHRTRGRNVRFNHDRTIAWRTDTEYCQGYVFTPRPVRLGELIVIQVLSTESMFTGYLGLGLTSCDPANLQCGDLPDDSNFLLDRPEYWVISTDFARNLVRGDEIAFCISSNGEVQISKNGNAPSVVIHVDQTLKLWAFFDIYGSTQKIRVLSSPPPSPVRNSVSDQQQQQQQRIILSPTSTSTEQVNGIAVLSVILPPAHANLLNQQAAAGSHRSSHHHSSSNSVQNQNNNAHTSQYIVSNNHSNNHRTIATPIPTPVVTSSATSSGGSSIPTGTLMSNYSNTYIEPIFSNGAYSTLHQRPTSGSSQDPFSSGGPGTECTICYENAIDSVLYMCGHMCMCYECALQQWRGKGGGHCPLCRAVIRDVIRTYKS